MHAFTFTPTTNEDFAALLAPRGFTPLPTPARHELVWGKAVEVNGNVFRLRIYTAINADGTARGKGKDAIRCQIWACSPDGVPYKVRGMKRTMRVTTWASNLARKIDTLQSWALEQPAGSFPHQHHVQPRRPVAAPAPVLSEPKCPRCGAGLTPPKNGRLGLFRGCVRYPVCRGLVPCR